jgi:hypothetical protein
MLTRLEGWSMRAGRFDCTHSVAQRLKSALDESKDFRHEPMPGRPAPDHHDHRVIEHQPDLPKTLMSSAMLAVNWL